MAQIVLKFFIIKAFIINNANGNGTISVNLMK
jgi:hypothetical protein